MDSDQENHGTPSKRPRLDGYRGVALGSVSPAAVNSAAGSPRSTINGLDVLAAPSSSSGIAVAVLDDLVPGNAEPDSEPVLKDYEITPASIEYALDVLLRINGSSYYKDLLQAFMIETHNRKSQGALTCDEEHYIPDGTQWRSYDPKIDKLWDNLVRDLDAFGVARWRLVKPSGRLNASLFIMWHYPTLTTTKYPRFGMCGDPTNVCMQVLARKLNLDLSFKAFADDILMCEHNPERYDKPVKTTSKRTGVEAGMDTAIQEDVTFYEPAPYTIQVQEVQDRMDDFKWTLYHLSESPVAVFLGWTNYKEYQIHMRGKATFVGGVKKKSSTSTSVKYAYALELDAPGTRVQRIAIFLTHPESFLYPTSALRAREQDNLMNAAGAIAKRSLISSNYFEYQSGTIRNGDVWHPTDPKIKDLIAMPLQLAMRIRKSEILYDTQVPLHNLPEALTEAKSSGVAFRDFYDPRLNTSFAQQCLVVLGRAGGSRVWKPGNRGFSMAKTSAAEDGSIKPGAADKFVDDQATPSAAPAAALSSVETPASKTRMISTRDTPNSATRDIKWHDDMMQVMERGWTSFGYDLAEDYCFRQGVHPDAVPDIVKRVYFWDRLQLRFYQDARGKMLHPQFPCRQEFWNARSANLGDHSSKWRSEQSWGGWWTGPA